MSRAHGLRSYLALLPFLTASLLAAPSFAADDPATKDKSQRKAEEKSLPTGKPSAAAKLAEPEPPLPPIELPPGTTIFNQSDVERKIRGELDRPTEIQYLDTQLSDAAADLQSRHKIPIALDKAALTADGKGPDTTLTLQFREGSLRSALRLLLDEQGLTYVVRNDSLLITTKTAAETYTTTRIYQVHDLVVMPNDPTAAKPDLQPLIDLIHTVVAPETWVDGGGYSGMQPFVGPGIVTLVITQTEGVHEQVESLLTMLREARESKVLEMQKRAKPIDDEHKRGRVSGGGMF